MSGLKSRLGKGSLWITANRALVNLLGLISTVVLARLLVPADFGLVALGTTMLTIITALTDTQMSQALVHHKNPTIEHMHAAWTLGVMRGTLVGGLFAASGPFFAEFYGDPRLAAVMYTLGFSIFLSGCTNPRRVMLQRDLIFWQDFLLNVSQKLVGVIVSIVIAYQYRSYWALLIGTIAGQLTNVAVSYTAMRYSPRPTLRLLNELFSFSFWLTLSKVINTINWKFDQLLIGKFLGRHDLGLYTVGDNFAQLPTRESVQPLTLTLFPAFAKLAHDRSRLRHAYQRAQAMISAIAMPMGVGVALVAYPLVFLAMGEKWMPVALVIQILASVFAFQTLGTPAQPLAMAMGHTKTLFRRDMQLFAIRLPIIILGMYLDGLRGVLIARSISGTIAIAFNFVIVKSLIGLTLREQLIANARVISSILIMVVGVTLLGYALPNAHTFVDQAVLLVASGSLGAFLYIGSTGLFWHLAGRPVGPETEVAGLLATVRRKFRPSGAI